MSDLRCPNCSQPLPRSTKRENSGIVACTHCHKAFRIRRKRQPVQKVEAALPADEPLDAQPAEQEPVDVLPVQEEVLTVEPVNNVVPAAEGVAEAVAVPAMALPAFADAPQKAELPGGLTDGVAATAPAAPKIAFTPAKGRPRVNWVLAFACIFVSGSVYTFLALPALIMQEQGKTGFGLLLLHLAANLGGALFAGFFASAMCPGDRLWQPLYTGLVVGFFDGFLLALVGVGILVNASDETPSATLLLLAAGIIVVISIVVVSAMALLGGAVERSLMKLALRLQPARHWIYETRQGKKIAAAAPLRYPVQARFWSSIRWLFLVAWVPLIWVSPKDVAKNIVPSIILFISCSRLSRKRRVASAQDALNQDKRPPIVYLRSFRDDGRTSGASGWSNWTGAGLGALVSSPFEEVLAKVMQRYGPFVAIGRPGEEVAEMGAARMYVGDDDWQSVVSDLLARPGSMALLQAGETAGLHWELHTAGEMLRPDQLLIFLPFAFEPSDRACGSKYRAFRSWASECLPAAVLPEKFPEKTRFFYFNRRPGWEVHTLQRASKVSDQHPLAEVLVDLQRDWGLLRPKRRTPRWLLVSLLLLAGLFVFAILIALLAAAILNPGAQPVISTP
ncbi:MAG TPA: hypothetical protein VGZ47_14270 [Gemmataceae bacterium]|jgi:hypothetical protein|nr:hypothetical protein [Gemmataceae bacterium]